jgi:hypothetical protein
LARARARNNPETLGHNGRIWKDLASRAAWDRDAIQPSTRRSTTIRVPSTTRVGRPEGTGRLNRRTPEAADLYALVVKNDKKGPVTRTRVAKSLGCSRKALGNRLEALGVSWSDLESHILQSRSAARKLTAIK